MDHGNDCSHLNCAHTSACRSVCQTLSEMDWERGIWYAAYNGDLKRIQTLIDKAKNCKEAVNLPDNAGYTALHYAARNGYLDVCKILLHYGADINAQTRSGNATPLHKAAAADAIGTGAIVIESLRKGLCPAVDVLRLNRWITIMAISKISTIKLLIQSGARVDMQDADGQTALHKAVKSNYNDIVNVLLEACPQLVDIKDCKGNVAIKPTSN